jgi:hypothetical protein
MFGDGFEMAPITRTSWAERESILVEAREAELLVLRRRAEFHREALGFRPSWDVWNWD